MRQRRACLRGICGKSERQETLWERPMGAGVNMWKNYNEVSFQFTIGGAVFHTLNLVYERFERTIPGHCHGSGCYEIHYISSGYGQALIGGKYYEVEPNTLFVTGPHVEHAQIPFAQDPMCEYCVYLQMEKKRRGNTVVREEAHLVSMLERTPFWFGQDTQQTGRIMRFLFREAEEQKTGYELQAKAFLYQLVVALVRNYESGKQKKSVAAPAIMDQAAVIVEEYFLYEYRNLSLEELSARLGLSVRQTQRLLQKYYGKTFLQKKSEARMSAAVVMLADPDKSITAIAGELGYSSVEHFSSAFRAWYGMGPRQYRKSEKPIGQMFGDE